MNTQITLKVDRLVWLALLSVMAAALVTDQARANLHPGARATPSDETRMHDRLTAEAWCRMSLRTRTGDFSITDEGIPGDAGAQRSAWHDEASVKRPRRSREFDAVR